MANRIKQLIERWRRKVRLNEVKSFNEDQRQQRAFETLERGVQRVALDQIVGSVGRYHDFDRRFRPKHHLSADRYEGIKQTLRDGKKMPPVKLYQIKDEYYVLDGNHRIAAAKELGHTDIEATIMEFIPSQNTLEHLLYSQRARFTEKTSLPHNITLTEVGQYDYIFNQIRRHQTYLEQKKGSATTVRAAALDWYATIYRPLSGIIRKAGLLKYFPNRTLDDLYAYVSLHQWEKGRIRGYGISLDQLIPNDMEAFREKMADTCKTDYPEMLREITAFVLMNVRGKNEDRIIEKLFALDEVQEIHAIHGNVDLLVKVRLMRDLLTSDAEIISVFVNDQMRLIPGVLSTQTLIPGRSLLKK